MTHPVANTFDKAAELIAADANRRGNCLQFKAGDRIIYTGDIHGNRKNLAKIIAYAALGAHPQRRLILHEIIHGGPTDPSGGDRSVETLLRAARLKISYPEQVFFLLANHDIAQITGNEITKGGCGVCKAFDAGLDNAFGPDAAEVRSAVNRLLRSQPLAAMCANGALMAHSVPGPERIKLIDWEIFNRPYEEEDFHRGGSLYEWTWGQVRSPEQLDELADRLDVKWFMLGHRLIESGYEIHHDRAVILASNHAHGAVMEFDAGEPLSEETLKDYVYPIVSL